MRKRNGVIWPVEAEDALRFLVANYTDSVASLASNIAAEGGRRSSAAADVAYADAVLRGEILDREERAAFVRGFDRNAITPSAQPEAAASRTCRRCDVSFATESSSKSYCSADCMEADRRERRLRHRSQTCELCGDGFICHSQRKRCDNCRGRALRGYYVYAWLDAGRLFYVGIGTGRRGYISHNNAGRPAKCDVRRRSIGDRFKVAIVRDNLTEEGARLLESTLINFLRPECNVQGGSSRAFNGLLTLDGHEFNGGLVQKHQSANLLDERPCA